MPNKNYLYTAFVVEVIRWYKEINDIVSDEEFNQKNDLSKLKLLKIFFLFSSKSEEVLRRYELNFLAMQYGPVEEGFYDFIKTSVFRTDFVINNYKTQLGYNRPILDQETSTIVESVMRLLCKENDELVNMRAFDLVDLTHAWNSWKLNYQAGKKNLIACEDILSDSNQFYVL